MELILTITFFLIVGQPAAFWLIFKVLQDRVVLHVWEVSAMCIDVNSEVSYEHKWGSAKGHKAASLEASEFLTSVCEAYSGRENVFVLFREVRAP